MELKTHQARMANQARAWSKARNRDNWHRWIESRVGARGIVPQGCMEDAYHRPQNDHDSRPPSEKQPLIKLLTSTTVRTRTMSLPYYCQFGVESTAILFQNGKLPWRIWWRHFGLQDDIRRRESSRSVMMVRFWIRR